MLEFWISASAMIAVALAFVLPALVARQTARGPTRAGVNLTIYRERRSELEAEYSAGAISRDAFDAALAEMDRELLRDAGSADSEGVASASTSPYPAIAVAVLLPVVAFGVYLKLGTPKALLTEPAITVAAGTQEAASRPEDIPHSVQEMVARLEERMRDNPNDPDGWLMLGRSYAAMNRLDLARKALETADQQRPDHPFTLVALAEVLAGQQGNTLDGLPAELVNRALEIEPDFARALWLAGVHAFNREDRDEALQLWQRLLATPGLSPEAAAQVSDAIAQAGGAPVTMAETNTRNDAGASIVASVVLSPKLASRLDGSETLFVFARAASGPPMPLAVVRRPASELPLTVTLDDSMAMTPQMKLSAFDPVVVSARVSRSGGATPTPGDLQGRSEPLSPGSRASVNVIIDQVVQ